MTSPASSGPAGPHFEGQVGAYYLLALLAGAEGRGLPACTVDRVRLQGSPEGHSLDDVIVSGHDALGNAVSLEIQAKRNIDFTPSDDVFAAVMVQVSEAVRDPGFWNVTRELAVATAHHSRQIDGAYQDVLTWARELGDAASFHRRLQLPKVASDPMRRFVSTFRGHLKTNGVDHDDHAVWALLRRFQILVFDFTAKGSVAEDLAKERAVRILLPGHEQRASDLWRQLVELSIQIAASGGDRTREQLLQDLVASFQFVPLRRHQEALSRLGEFSRQALADIDTRISGVRLSRQTYVRELWASLDKGRYIDIRGDAGVGKSGILRYFAEQLSVQGRIIVLSPNRTFQRGWAGMRLVLDFSGTCRELLSEIAGNGGGAIFVDNLDFFGEDERPTVVDLVREAAAVPGLAVVTTARRMFGTIEKSWLPSEALDQLGRTPTISVGEIDDSDLEELRSSAPQLAQLLTDDHPARDVIRNLFRLSQLAERPDSLSLPRTEAEMAKEWWRQAGSSEVDGKRERARFLKALAEHSLISTEPVDTSQSSAESVDSLVRNETLIELKTDRVVFRHDVFREWALACLLSDAPEAINQLPLNKPAPADLGRAVELLARLKIENATDTGEWLNLLVALSNQDVHGSWRRVALLALVRSESSFRVLDIVAPILVYNKAALLCELIRLTMALDVEPARARFAAVGLDEKTIPSSMNVPSGLSWFRLIAWLVYRLKTNLPPEAIPDVVKLYSGWCLSFMGGDGLTTALVEQMYHWLREIELDREKHPHWENPGVFSGSIQGDLLRSLEDTLRFNFLAFAFRAPLLAAEYLESFKARTYSDEIKIGILQFRGSLAQAAPAELVDFTLSTLIPEEQLGRQRHGGLPEGPFGFTDGKFLPCSPAQGPFFDLLIHSPQNGLRLIRRLVDYSISFFSRGTTPARDGITIHLSDGPKFFPWVRTYMWSREAYGGPYLVTSGLMALEAWAQRRLDSGESFELVLQDVIGDAGAPAAYLLPVVDLILSHWSQSQRAAIPFLGSPELLCLDRSRFVRDNGPEFPDILGLKELQKEPPGIVSNEDLKMRPSRRAMLDQVLGHYASVPELHDPLHVLLQQAAERLGPATESHTLGDPAFMVVHALNMIDPHNWQATSLTLNDGTVVPGKEFVVPAAEASHMERLQREFNEQHSDEAMRAAIKAANNDSKRSTSEFLKRALDFVQTSTESDGTSEDARMPGELAPREEDSIRVALLIARDGDQTLRQQNDNWIRQTLAQSFTEREGEMYRYRSEYQFNPQAFSFVGYACLLRNGINEDNIRLLLEAASYSSPSVATGFKVASTALAEIDERLIRAILRCALTARIAPSRDWQLPEAEQEQQVIECKENVASRIDSEVRWLISGGEEPQWPQFPVERPSLRNGYRRRKSDPEDEQAESPRQRFDFRGHGASQWLKASEGLLDVAVRPWLREFAAEYREWTAIANGVGIDKDEQIDGEPSAWNEEYFKLAAFCLPGISLDEIAAVILSYFDRMPDETLFDNLGIFLRSVDNVFFNRNALSIEMAVLVRTIAGNLIQSTSDWKRLKDVRKDSAEIHISGAVSTFYFNDSGGFMPSKCYLTPAAIPRITPFLGTLETLALDCRCPLIGSVALNLIEVAPSVEHFNFLLSIGTAWVETYDSEVRFWIEYQFGKRICTLIETILKVGMPASGQARHDLLDRLLGHLVRLGIPEARRAEDLLRTADNQG